MHAKLRFERIRMTIYGAACCSLGLCTPCAQPALLISECDLTKADGNRSGSVKHKFCSCW